MLAVISPAKDLDYASPLPSVAPTEPRLLADAALLMQDLKCLAPFQVAQLMHLSDNLADLNYQRFAQWQLPLQAPAARPALLAFNGDVYQGLQAATFNAADFAFAQGHLRILSGLYGVLRPLDLMLPYRLEMGTAFANPRGANLYAFWGERITQLLREDMAACGARVLVNLASQEYFKAVRPKLLGVPVIEPVFKDYHAPSGSFKVISFFAKKARGQMSAYIVKQQLTAAEGLKSFDGGGYSFNSAMSTAQQWVFTRRLSPA